MILYKHSHILKAQSGTKIPVPKPRSASVPEHNSRLDYTMPASMRARKPTASEIEAEKQARIKASIEARKTTWSKDNWRQKLSDETQAIGDKISLQNIPVVGKYIPDMLDATGGIGNMASSLGSAPLNAKQANSVLPYLSAVGIPLAGGALASMGAKNTSQFINNVLNPLAGAEDVVRFANKGKKSFQNVVLDSRGNLVTDNETIDIAARQIPAIDRDNALKYMQDIKDHEFFLNDIDFSFPKTESELFLDNIKIKHRAEFEKLYGDNYTDKDLGVFAKMKEAKSFRGLNEGKIIHSLDDVMDSYSPTSTVDSKLDTKIKGFIDEHEIDKVAYSDDDYTLSDAYTRGYDSAINNRPSSGHKSLAFYKDKLNPMFEDLVLKAKLKSSTELRRGTYDYAVKSVIRNGEKLPDYSVRFSELLKNDEYIPESFVSTTLDKNVLSSFGEDLAHKITAPAGQSVHYPNVFKNTNFPMEQEVILPSKLRFKIDKVNELPIKGVPVDDFNKYEMSIINPYKITGAIGGGSLLYNRTNKE